MLVHTSIYNVIGIEDFNSIYLLRLTLKCFIHSIQDLLVLKYVIILKNMVRLKFWIYYSLISYSLLIYIFYI